MADPTSPPILGQLVQLATLGTSGLCVLAVFLGFNLVLKMPNDASVQRVSLVRFYLKICFCMAICTSLSGGLNAYFNYQETLQARLEQKRAEDDKAKSEQKIAKIADLSLKIDHEKIRLGKVVQQTVPVKQQQAAQTQFNEVSRLLDELRVVSTNPDPLPALPSSQPSAP